MLKGICYKIILAIINRVELDPIQKLKIGYSLFKTGQTTDFNGQFLIYTDLIADDLTGEIREVCEDDYP